MTSVTPEARGHDHKSWLNDIERWRYDLKVWDGQTENMRNEAAAVVAAVEQFLADTGEHRDSLARLEHRIADSERREIAHTDSEDVIAGDHRDVAATQEALYRNHRRLETRRRELMSALSVVGH